MQLVAPPSMALIADALATHPGFVLEGDTAKAKPAVGQGKRRHR
jgi:hypothetical protein